MTDKVSDEELVEMAKQEKIENKKKADEFIAKQKANTEYTLEQKQEKLAEIQRNVAKIDMVKLKEVMEKYNVTSFADPEVVNSKAIDEILALI